MTVHFIDVSVEPRWANFLQSHPKATIFHTAGWVEALRRTYGYEPMCLTTSAPDEELTNGLVACRVKSRITGNRIVSVPFADYCDPLLTGPGQLEPLVAFLDAEVRSGKSKYVEFRPTEDLSTGSHSLAPAQQFYLHRVDLAPELNQVFAKFNKNNIQRKIHKAEREQLKCEAGNSEALLAQFYRLMVMTRKRLGVPPQPRSWFRNLIACLGDAVTIRVASKDQEPLAAVLTLSFKDTLVYKYGCSDARYHNLGSMQFLFWECIQHAKSKGLKIFDLGRSDRGDAGLVEYKDRWGSQRSMLSYKRLERGEAGSASAESVGWKQLAAKRVFQSLPASLAELAGNLLYRHAG